MHACMVACRMYFTLVTCCCWVTLPVCTQASSNLACAVLCRHARIRLLHGPISAQLTFPPVFPAPFPLHAGVLKGLEESMTAGNLAGFPVVDVTCTLYDGSYHEVDSSALAFQIAARGAFREAMQKCGARLLEPVMKVGDQTCWFTSLWTADGLAFADAALCGHSALACCGLSCHRTQTAVVDISATVLHLVMLFG